MGEICKYPKNAVAAALKEPNIEGIRAILEFLIVQEGIAQTIRILQYALEDLASSINFKNKVDKETAALYYRAAETLEKPYQDIKTDEIKIIYET